MPGGKGRRLGRSDRDVIGAGIRGRLSCLEISA
ncbi:hypothetical protein HMPREF1008_00875 [Olsenella sp. oral taxon 809 str. F0356]|nr:hypothetical protein HMPREF1008_00875 [Olsenella sp. oral taxon 809 str. F0356]